MTRRLAAILAADVVGYSALMGWAEEGMIARIEIQVGMLYEPVDHLSLEGSVLIRELPRPNLPTVVTTGDPHTSLSVGA